MIFDEMYLQKRQEYFGGEMIGGDDEGELYKGIICFMVVGLKESIPYVIKKHRLKPTLTPIGLKQNFWTPSKFFLTVAFVLELSFVTIIQRLCLVSRNCWNISSKIRMNYICYTSPEKSTTLLRRCPFNKKRP